MCFQFVRRKLMTIENLPANRPPDGAPAFSDAFATADIADALPNRTSLLDAAFRHFGGKKYFAGRCSTLVLTDDPQSIANAVAEDGGGRVLVICGRAHPQFACIGDRLAALAARSGWAGCVIIGAVRDSESLKHIDLGVAALRTTALRGYGVASPGERDGTINFAGVAIVAGTALYADGDAVILVADK
jgi:regulator of ribonuclease activity A